MRIATYCNSDVLNRRMLLHSISKFTSAKIGRQLRTLNVLREKNNVYACMWIEDEAAGFRPDNKIRKVELEVEDTADIEIKEAIGNIIEIFCDKRINIIRVK